jgi:3-oxoacyl-[acyl-carrier protein] reductase
MSELRRGDLGEYALAGRVAVVTGGSNGIGAATVRRLAAADANVVVGYNAGLDRANALVAALPGDRHMAVHLPMEDTAAIRAAAALVEKTYGRADVLVNSAALTKAVPHVDLEAMDDGLFDRILTANVRGPFATIRAFVPMLRASGDGVVINVSSLSGSTGQGSCIAYCASKAALDTMGLSLGRVLGPEIRIIGVAPAAVATDFVQGRTMASVEKQAETTPLKTVTQADDVALTIMAAITHMRLSTGTTLVVDGGRHL